jgi:DNA-binding response OmpR family regulator
MNLLLVESPRFPQDSLAADLVALGYAVDRVGDGNSAIVHAAQREYDVIVLDLRRPSESSLFVLHEIRESDRRVDILVLAARNQIHDRVTALIQGADDYLVIPVSAKQLHARIERLARRRRGIEIGDTPVDAGRRVRHLDRLIANLLQFCNPEGGGIEQVISEVRTADLLRRMQSQLATRARQHTVALRIETADTPTLLVDAGWLEQLLTNLVYHLITICPAGDTIRIGFSGSGESGNLDIVSNADAEPDLSLLRTCARHLNLEISQTQLDVGMRIRVSNLRIL